VFRFFDLEENLNDNLVFHLNERMVYNFDKMSLFILQNDAGRQKLTAEIRAKLKK